MEIILFCIELVNVAFCIEVNIKLNKNIIY